MSSLRIAYLASEVAPFAKTGGLADVGLSLPRTLSKLGHDVRVFLPAYASIDRSAYGLENAGIPPVPIELGGPAIEFTLLKAKLPASEVPVYFVDCPRFYARQGLYTNDPDEPIRFVFFCRAVFESCQRLGFGPDLFHANDWQSALTPLLAKTLYAWDELFARTKTLLTIHNIAYQGAFAASAVNAVGIADRKLFDETDLREGRVIFLKTGLRWADRLSTVSPTYATEIQTPAQGYGLDPILRERRSDLVGILNGVDYDEWDPARDEHLVASYSAGDLSGKAENKRALIEDFGLTYSPEVPLVGMITRLSYQKGIELLYDALPALLASGDQPAPMQLIVLGTGEAKYERYLHELEHRFRDRVRFYHGFSEALAHRIEAGADLFLMPSRYEPCGLNQMYSLRYGTVPIVRRTGGLADSVRQFDPVTGEGTGILFDHFTSEGVAWGLRTGLRLFHDKDLWARLVANGMAEDFSWSRQAERYLDLYREMVGASPSR